MNAGIPRGTAQQKGCCCLFNSLLSSRPRRLVGCRRVCMLLGRAEFRAFFLCVVQHLPKRQMQSFLQPQRIINAVYAGLIVES